MSSKQNRSAPVYKTLREGYTFLSGTVQGYPHFNPMDQCFCEEKNECWPVQTCGSCNLEKSGQCPQQSAESPIPGV